MEERLTEVKTKNFKIGQKVWHLLCLDGDSVKITKDIITNITDSVDGKLYSLKVCRFCAKEEDLFYNKKEARNRLEVLNGLVEMIIW